MGTSNVFTLDDLQDAVERKYGSFVIQLDEETAVTLLNPMRLSTEKRQEFSDIRERLGDDDVKEAEREAALRDALQVVADTPGGGKKLIAAIGDDTAKCAALLEAYVERVQAGEASGSQD